MVFARAVGMKVNDPKRAQVALYALEKQFQMPGNTDAFGVATCCDNSVLLTKIPSAPSKLDLAKAIGPIKGTCAVAQFRQSDELRPARERVMNSNLGPFRLKSFAAAVVGGPQDPDQANYNREQLLCDLPDFLARCISGQTEAEALFFKIMAAAYKMGILDQQIPNTVMVAESIHTVLAKLEVMSPRCIVFATGHDVIHVALGMPSAVVHVQGLCPDTASEVSISMVETPANKECLRQFNGVFSFGGLSERCVSDIELPDGMDMRCFDEDATFVLGKEIVFGGQS